MTMTTVSVAVQVYTRDQQITTAKGIVMARLRSSVRELEVALMKFCFDKLGALCHPACMVTLHQDTVQIVLGSHTGPKQ